ncbi:MAG: hypothetical protein ACOC07_07475 [Coleofasciculus sp.]
MAYSNFTLAKVKENFDLTVDETKNLFADVPGVQPSELLTLTLAESIPLATAIDTEKARSEFIIAPVLSEVRRQVNYQVSLFSGTDFNVDIEKGLQGYCDFILSCSFWQSSYNPFKLIYPKAPEEMRYVKKSDDKKFSLFQTF